MSALALESVDVRRGSRRVLDDVTATFQAGKVTAVIGPNGAGKSTLLEVAAGLLRPRTGAVRLGGTPLGQLPRRVLARRRAYLPQSPQVDWPISVERVVALGLTSHLPTFGDLPEAWSDRIDAALEQFDLVPLRHRPATRLSGGELARAMLARATVGDPEVLIVDEPTAGLDPRHALDAGRRLRALADAGCAVVVALHDLDLAMRIADDVVAMRDARVLTQGSAASVFSDDVLGRLYDVPARVLPTAAGQIVRFFDRLAGDGVITSSSGG